jgi:hypothetical protein
MHGNNSRAAVMRQTAVHRPLMEGGAIRPLRNQMLGVQPNIHPLAGPNILFAACLTVLLPLWTAAADSPKAMDTERSVLTVRVYKAGL